MKSKIIESVGYISIALILALTLVLSFSVVEFNSGVTAHAAAPSENTLNIYPGSTSILAPGFDYEAAEFFYNDGDNITYNIVSADVTLDSSYIANNPGALFQFIFYVDVSLDDDVFLYMSSVSCLDYSDLDVAGDDGFGDQYFVFGRQFSGDSVGDYSSFDIEFWQYLDDYYPAGWERAYLYDIRLIEPNSDNSDTADNFFSIVGNGISFGFEAIADGITYTVENLFFVDGRLSDFSIIIFCMTGVSLALAVIKYILRIIFSFGGIKL